MTEEPIGRRLKRVNRNSLELYTRCAEKQTIDYQSKILNMMIIMFLYVANAFFCFFLHSIRIATKLVFWNLL